MLNKDKIIEFFSETQIPHAPRQSVNFFDIGTRGHFENPFTDILAFLLTPHAGYMGAEKFAELFFECVLDREDIRSSFANACYVTTQVRTARGNFMDMVIYNNQYILAFENKIEHWLANPLEDYELEINNAFPSAKASFFVLSKNIEPAPKPWINLIIGEVFGRIRKNLKYDACNKWDVFTREFLDHYIQKDRGRMEDTTFEFCSNHFSKLIAGNGLLDSFIKDIIGKIQCSLDAKCGTSIDRNWGKDMSIAIRLRPNPGNGDDVVLVLRTDGRFGVSVYVHSNSLDKLGDLAAQMHGYKMGNEGAWRLWSLLQPHESIASAIQDVLHRLKLISVPVGQHL